MPTSRMHGIYTWRETDNKAKHIRAWSHGKHVSDEVSKVVTDLAHPTDEELVILMLRWGIDNTFWKTGD